MTKSILREQAFLMIHLDITKNPPEIYRVGTYSNKGITTFLGREIVVPILVGYGTDYADGLFRVHNLEVLRARPSSYEMLMHTARASRFAQRISVEEDVEEKDLN